MWSLGCILAELVQMDKKCKKNVHRRSPIFPGDSCYPLSPRSSGNKLKTGSKSRSSEYGCIFFVYFFVCVPSNEKYLLVSNF